MNILSKVKAQVIDAVASPTIPWEPPTGPTKPPVQTVTPTLSGPYITIGTNTREAGLNQKFTIEVKINTDGQEISSYQFLITYNTSLLRVVDSNPATPSKEINFLDTFFLPTEQTINETDTGSVFVSAEAESGTATISNSTVATIEFETLAEGFANIAVDKEGSTLINANETDILQSVNTIDITISSSVALPTPTQSGAIFPSRTPNTGIMDTFGSQSSILAGVVLITAGFFILKRINNAKIRR
jgi:hypothetical protein